jgi:hypothetical protein
MPSTRWQLSLTTGLFAVTTAQAGLGWTLEECKFHYGKPTAPSELISAGRVVYRFQSKGYYIGVAILNGRVSRIEYQRGPSFLQEK